MGTKKIEEIPDCLEELEAEIDILYHRGNSLYEEIYRKRNILKRVERLTTNRIEMEKAEKSGRPKNNHASFHQRIGETARNFETAETELSNFKNGLKEIEKILNIKGVSDFG